MSDDVRCPTCDLPLPTAAQWETMRGGEGVGLCWAAGACRGARIDWRGRALAAEALLGAAARGELPRCECWCGCSRLGTHEAGSGAKGYLCDGCLARYEPAANDRHDRGDWRDLPHAAALRAAMAKGGAT